MDGSSGACYFADVTSRTDSSPSHPDVRRSLWPIGLIVLATMITFFPVLNHPFVNWDDAMNLTENPEVGDLADVKITEDVLMYQASERLKDADIWNIVNYVRSIGPKKK